MTTRSASPWWHLFVPKLFTILKQGYSLKNLRADGISGLTVAIVALPLAMALGIASGAGPAEGLITVVIAGLLISLLGGSRYQIGGPTGAFVVVIFNVIAQHGYDGLIIATLLAGVILTVAGFARLGTWIKYIPQPVITGFTAGIAVIIFSSQIKDLFGLQIEKVPGEFFEKWHAFWLARDSFTMGSIIISASALAALILLKKFAPKLPAFLIAVIGASAAVWLFKMDVPTIGNVFGGIPDHIPAPQWPAMTLDKITVLLPSAFTIAFLAGVESLLSAVVADGMTGRRHRSNCELVAQGVANTASALFGGMPATGAIARTATNIRAGAFSPVSGVLHAIFVLLFMLFLAPLASFIPLACLAAILVIVAWNMSEIERFRHLMRAPLGDKAVLVITFLLTVAVDLTIAIQVGVVLAAFLFMHRMSQAVEMQTATALIENDIDDLVVPNKDTQMQRDRLPEGVEAFQIRGPFFFGVASRLLDVLDHLTAPPKVFILRMRSVPLIDASGDTALEEFINRCRKQGTTVIIAGMQPRCREILRQMGFFDHHSDILEVDSFQTALVKAEAVLERLNMAAQTST